MVYSVAQARKHIESKYAAVCESTLETMKAFLEQKKADLAKDLDTAIALQGELPGFDLSSYATVEKFEVSNEGLGNQAVSVDVGHRAAVNVVLRANKVYDAYFLMRERPSTMEAKTE